MVKAGQYLKTFAALYWHYANDQAHSDESETENGRLIFYQMHGPSILNSFPSTGQENNSSTKTKTKNSQKYACRIKTFVATKLCLLRQIFVATNMTNILCRDKSFVLTSIFFVMTKDFRREKHTFVATKMILVAAPVSGTDSNMPLTQSVRHAFCKQIKGSKERFVYQVVTQTHNLHIFGVVPFVMTQMMMS